MSELASCLDAEKDFSPPDLVYTHSPDDLNLDHVLTAIKFAEKPEHIQKLTPHVKKLTEAEQTKAREAATKKMAELKKG